eukprot:gene2862-4705_t
MKNVPKGTMRFDLHSQVKDKIEEGHTSAVVFEMVQLPKGADLNEWLAVHTIDFYNKINMIFSQIEKHCKCDSMKAGIGFEYLWKDHDKYKKPTVLPAHQYIEKVLDYVEKKLNEFPIDSNEFPKDYKKTVSKIFSRILRIYAHILHQHFDTLKELSIEKQTNMSLKHFFAFAYTFELISITELEALKDWALNYLNLNIKSKSKRKQSNVTPKTKLSIKEANSLHIEIVALSGFEEECSDLFIEFIYDKEEFTTEIIKKTINPEWNETFNLLIKNKMDDEFITFKLYSQINKNKRIELGNLEIRLNELFDEKRIDKWFEMNKFSSINNKLELRLILQFTSSESGMMNYLSALTSLEKYNELYTFLNSLSTIEYIQLFDNPFISFDELNIWKSILLLRNDKEDLLKTLFTLEINDSLEETLFRSNSLSTKLFFAYFKLIGQDYLQKTIGLAVQKVCNENLYLEIDPLRAIEGTNCDDKMKVILIYSKLFFNSIIESGDLIPNSIRHLLIHLEKEVSKKYENKTITAISALVMLRYICPSIITPQSFNLIYKTPEKNARRTLTLISKIIQQISNQILFKEKEEFMLPSNNFILKNMDLMEFFLKSLLKEPSSIKDSTLIPTNQQLLFSLYHVHLHFNNNLEKYKKSFDSKKSFQNYKSYPNQNNTIQNFKKFEKINQNIGIQQLSLIQRQKIKSSKIKDDQ